MKRIKVHRTTIVLWAASALLVACSGPTGTADSASTDVATSDATMDASSDASMGLDVDVGVDVGVDIGSTDAPATDADATATGTDAATDAGTIAVGEEVMTAAGPVRGQRSGGLVIFRGIPYAAPPVGPLRFRPPTPPAVWTTPRSATAFGPVCPQLTGTGFVGSEDCLSLNVWAHPSGPPRPVMVFIHGGGFIEGAGSVPWYEGTSLATATGAVVVTLNYRLGPQGFLATDALVSESPVHTAGNYGILDQVFALAWVQRNAAVFGGDPRRVTIFGESAGAASVCALLASPGARPYFHAAVVESGPCTLLPNLLTPGANGASAVAIGAEFARLAGCATSADPLLCLRQLPARTVVTVQRMLPWTNTVLLPVTPMLPVIDGLVIRGNPIDVVRAGDLGDVPLIVGSNADEAAMFLAGAPDTEAYYRATLDARFGTDVGPRVFALFPPAEFGGPRAALTQLAGNLAFNCPAEALADAASGGRARSYLYYLTRGWSTGPWAGRGAVHAIELFHVFGTFASAGQVPEAADLVMRDAMQGAWGSLVGGAPQLVPPWPAYARAAPQFATFDATTTIATAYRRGKCPQLRALGVTP